MKTSHTPECDYVCKTGMPSPWTECLKALPPVHRGPEFDNAWICQQGDELGTAEGTPTKY